MQALENQVSPPYSRKGTSANAGRTSETVQPLSNRPEDRGLYVITTYDEFFKADLEKSRNSTTSSK
jgi:hypothetical protein